MVIRRPLTLDSWHAHPLTADEAHVLLSRVHTALQFAYRQGTDDFEWRALELIGRYWLGADVAHVYRGLLRGSRTPAQAALAEMAYGQLLMSRRLTGATAHLRAGFSLAAHLFDAEAYFRVRSRHRLLELLPLASDPAPAADLDTLLREASIIRILKSANPMSERMEHDPRDTVA